MSAPPPPFAPRADTAAPKGADLEFVDNARDAVARFSDEITAFLIREAQSRAFRDGADYVLVKHVEEARNVVARPERARRSRKRHEGMKIFGSGFIGTALSGFPAALPKTLPPAVIGGTPIFVPADPIFLTLHAVLGSLGVLMVMSGVYGAAEGGG